jgi:hypothetical protein
LCNRLADDEKKGENDTLMDQRKKFFSYGIYLLIYTLLLLVGGCGNGDDRFSSELVTTTPGFDSGPTVSGKVTFDLVPGNSTSGLDYSKISQKTGSGSCCGSD